MKKLNTIILILLWIICTQLYDVQLNSIYPLKPNDSEAFYFTPENYPIKADGKMDVSDALQAAINQVKKEKNFGILFIPEGKYKISKTIYIPTAIRLIGYGKNRPEFILAKNSPGFQEEVADDIGIVFMLLLDIIIPHIHSNNDKQERSEREIKQLPF